MLYKQLSTVVAVVRLRYAVPFVLLLAAIYALAIHPWMANWGSTAAEQQMALPGDKLHPAQGTHTTQAVTIDAPADVVWQWLVQVGQDRAGFYTYTWLENLLGADIHNADRIHPEWQRLAVGDAWRLLPPGYFFGLVNDPGSAVLMSEPGRAIVLVMFGTYVIAPVDERTSRLIVRGQSAPPSVMSVMVADPVVFTMGRRMLLGLKARAEGQPDAPAALWVISQLGWVASGTCVAGLFMRRRRWPWLALPVAAALPALLAASDPEAGLAAFIAAGVTLLGFLIFGRRWLGAYLVIASLVLLTLVLAPEAHIAIGLSFDLLLIAAASVEFAARPRTRASTPGRMVTPAV